MTLAATDRYRLAVRELSGTRNSRISRPWPWCQRGPSETAALAATATSRSLSVRVVGDGLVGFQAEGRRYYASA